MMAKTMTNNSPHSLVMLAGGRGTRIGAAQPKQFLELYGFPMVLHSLLALKDIRQIGEIIINYPPDGRQDLEKVLKLSGLKDKVIRLCPAGTTRQDSVQKMLDLVTEKHVLVHEAARPMVDHKTFSALIDWPADNAGYMLEVPFTVAPVDPETRRVVGSLERRRLRNVQLPQKFVTAQLKDAHARAQADGKVFTEDACLIVEYGYEFQFLDGEARNIKITTREDLLNAELLMSACRESVV